MRYGGFRVSVDTITVVVNSAQIVILVQPDTLEKSQTNRVIRGIQFNVSFPAQSVLKVGK